MSEGAEEDETVLLKAREEDAAAADKSVSSVNESILRNNEPQGLSGVWRTHLFS